MEQSELKNYRALVLEVRQLRRQLEVLESSMYSPRGQRFSQTPRAAGAHGRTMDDVVAAHIELEDNYKAHLAAMEARQLRIESAIQSLPEPGQRLILRHRYIEGLAWHKIVTLLIPKGYSEREIFRAHRRALELLKDK